MDVYVNGQWTDRDSATVDIEDRAHVFGDGIYEVIRVYGGVFYERDGHLDRFERSAREIGIKLPVTREELLQLLQEGVRRNEIHDGTVYFQVSRGVAARKHPFPDPEVRASLMITTKEAPRPVEAMEKGVSAITCEDIRWLRCDIKSLNLLGNVMANQKAVEAGAFEAIQHRAEVVTEGSHSNVMMVKDGTVYTHPANNLILNGITRMRVLALCKENGIEVQERECTLSEYESADEVFFTGTTVEVMPVISINGTSVSNGTVGPVARQLQKAFEVDIEAQTKEVKLL